MNRRLSRQGLTFGLTLLAALLVVGSCEVERLPTGVGDPTIVPADPPVARVEPPITRAEPPEIRPEEGPVFTPMTVRPEIRNRSEVQAALMREYPPILRDAGIGGTVVVWFFITEDGVVQDKRVSRSSGQVQFDEAALEVADVFRFSPALNRDHRVQVWIEVPITFQVR